MVRLAIITALVAFATAAWAADDDIVGTYRLISANRVILATGETEESYGKNPIGFMTYGREGPMMGMIVFSNRARAESLDKMTDSQRADLFRTMIAYGGTYTRPCSVGLMTALGWMSFVFVAIGPAYTVDAYSGGLRGHCTFIHSKKQNKNRNWRLDNKRA